MKKLLIGGIAICALIVAGVVWSRLAGRRGEVALRDAQIVRVTATAREILLDVDADKMRTVIRNLVENAVKYSLPDSGPVEVSAAEDGDSVVIRVTDDGPGIPDGDLASVFEPFFRVDRSRSKKTGGYGLGLSIAKRIVEAHSGSLALRNNPGRGVTFVATLPKTQLFRAAGACRSTPAR